MARYFRRFAAYAMLAEVLSRLALKVCGIHFHPWS